MTHPRPQPRPLRVRREVLVLLFLATVAAGASGPAPVEVIEVPLTMVGGRPHIDVFIDGEGPYPFVLDTGASLNVIDTGIARELGLEVIGEREIGAPGMEQIPAEVVGASRLIATGLELSDVELVTMDLASMSGGVFLGVLRFGVFADKLATLNLGTGSLQLSEDSLDPDSEGVIAYVGDDGLIDIPISIGDLQLTAHLDSGSPGRFTLPGKLTQELSFLERPVTVGRVQLVGGQGTASRAQLDGSLVVGSLRFENPEVTIVDVDIPKANLGSRFLVDHVVRIDQGHRLIHFEPVAVRSVQASPSTLPATNPEGALGGSPSGNRRLGLRPAPGPPGPNGLPMVEGGLLVDSVDPDSLADRAGITGGDLVVAVNGTPIADFDMGTLAALFRGSEPLHLDVRRAGGGEVQVIEIP